MENPPKLTVEDIHTLKIAIDAIDKAKKLLEKLNQRHAPINPIINVHYGNYSDITLDNFGHFLVKGMKKELEKIVKEKEEFVKKFGIEVK